MKYGARLLSVLGVRWVVSDECDERVVIGGDDYLW